MLTLCVLFTASCGNELDAPSSFRLNEQTLGLSWDKVKGAMSYAIQISGEEREKTTRSNSLELEYLAAGTYEIKVKAIGNGVDSDDSDWSVYTFERAAESGLKYKLTNGNTEYQLVGGGNASGDVVIDDYYRGKPVTSIADKALYNNSRITSLVVGSNIKSIGEKAFAKCSSLTSITIKNGVTQIGDYLFQSSKALETITIGDQITYVGDYAFSNCKALKEISLPDTVGSIGEYAFSDCESMTKITLGNGIKTIATYAFSNCKELASLTLPEQLISLASYAFSDCLKLESVVIPDSVETMDIEVFSGCTALADITLGAGLKKIGGGAFLGTAFLDGYEGSLVTLDGWVILNKDLEITKITLPDDIYGIADYAFSGCKNEKFEQINLSGIKYVGDYAFYGCKNVWNATFDSALLTIGNAAFAYCDYLESVNVGESLEKIGASAFYECKMLADMELPDSLKEIGGGAFTKTRAYTSATNKVVYIDDWVVGNNFPTSSYLLGMTVRDNIKGIASYSFYNANLLGDVSLPNSITYIGRSAFYNCAYINVNLPNSLTYIDDYAFYGCASSAFGADKTLRIPAGVEYIGRSAFYACSSITGLHIPSSVKTIGDYAFYGCKLLGGPISEEENAPRGEIIIDEGVITIGNRAFQFCESMTEIKIPDSVTTIGSHMFYKCIALKNIIIGNSITEIPEYTFFNCEALENVILPDGIRSIGKYAFRKCALIREINVSGVESLGDYAFYRCSGITAFHFRDSLKTIGNYALRGCTSVSAILLPSSVETVGKHAFYGMNGTTIYCEAASASSGWEERFNTSYRPIFFGCTLSDNNDYVVSVTVDKNNPDNVGSVGGISDPTRAGYTFSGWATAQGSSEVAYTSETVANAPAATTLYAVWVEVINEEIEQ